MDQDVELALTGESVPRYGLKSGQNLRFYQSKMGPWTINVTKKLGIQTVSKL